MKVTELIAEIEAAESIDDTADKVASVARRLIGTGVRRDLLTGRWLGHPAHPMVIALPLGAWISAAAVDVLGGHGAQRISRHLILVGLAGAAPAAATGLADWSDTSGAERRSGFAHAVGNGLAVTLYAASWTARATGHHRTGRLLSGVGLAAVGAAGYLGGHLAYVRGVGINTTAFQSGPDEWSVAGTLADLPVDAPAAVRHRGIDLVVIRREHRVDVLEDRCTHRGGPLSDGSVDDGCIECPWHGSGFDTETGAVQRGPASVPQPVYEARVQDGHVEIRRREEGGLRRNPIGARGAGDDPS